MKFRRLLKPIAKPVFALFAQYLVPGAEYEHTLLRSPELTLQAESDASERSKERFVRVGSRLKDSLVSPNPEEVGADALATQDLAHSLEERLSILDARTAELDNRMAALGVLAGELHARALELERGAAWDRQAIHDLAHGAVGHGEDHTALNTVGVVVPTCDRPDSLARALVSLDLQTRSPDIVVVVNDGQDEIDAVLERFSDRLNIVALRTPAPCSGSAAARNVALDALRTSLVAFLDDDNLMWSGWIERATRLLERDPVLSVVYGVQLRDVEDSVVDKQWFLAPFDLERLRTGNFIDMNQIMHRATDMRFNPALRRLVDWDYVLQLVGNSPERITPVNAISSVYSAARQDRISTAHWPPDLSAVVASRRIGETMRWPDGQHACSCCGYVGRFSAGPRQQPQAACPGCGALERHRFAQLVAPLVRSFWVPETRPHQRAAMMEIGASRAMQAFRQLFGFVTTALPMPADAVDVALVLDTPEHAPRDTNALAGIARALRPTGVALLQAPSSGRPEAGDVMRLAEGGLASIAISPGESMPPETLWKYGLRPDEALVFAVRADSSVALDRLSLFASRLRKGRL